MNNIFSGISSLAIPDAVGVLAMRGVSFLASYGLSEHALHLNFTTSADDAHAAFSADTPVIVRTGALGGSEKFLVVIEGAIDAMTGLPETVEEHLSNGRHRRWYISNTALPSGAWNSLRVRCDDAVVTLDMSALPSGGNMAELPTDVTSKIASETLPWRAPLQAFRFVDHAQKYCADIALAYTQLGYAVLPIRASIEPDLPRMAPLTDRVTAEPANARLWFPPLKAARGDGIGVGIPTGGVNRLIAIYVNDGNENKAKWSAIHEEHRLPETLVISETGCCNRYIYALPDGAPIPGTGNVTSGIGVCGEHGWMLASNIEATSPHYGFSFKVAVADNRPVAEMPAEALAWLAEQVPADGDGWKLTSGISLIVDDNDVIVETNDERKQRELEEAAQKLAETELTEFKYENLIRPGESSSMLHDIVHNVSEHMRISPWAVYGGMIATAAQIIGANMMLDTPYGLQPLIVWLAIIAKSGSGKSGFMDKLGKTIKERQLVLNNIWTNNHKEYEEELENYNEEKKRAKKNGETIDIKRPREPIKEKYWVRDATPEMVLKAATDNPGGVAWTHDELSGLIRSWGLYNSVGADAYRDTLLSAYTGDAIAIERKTTDDIYQTSQGWVSIIGTIQPKKLRKIFSSKDLDDGFLQRFLMFFGTPLPPMKIDERPQLREDIIREFFSALLSNIKKRKKYASEDNDEPDPPAVVTMDDEALAIWKSYVENFEERAYLHYADDDEYSLNRRFAYAFSRVLFAHYCMENVQTIAHGAVIDAATVRQVIDIFEGIQRHSRRGLAIIKGEKVSPEILPNEKFINTVESFLKKHEKSHEMRMYFKDENKKDVKSEIIKALSLKNEADLQDRMAKLGFMHDLLRIPGNNGRCYGYRIAIDAWEKKKAELKSKQETGNAAKHS